jgi:hypothetical protein
MTVNMKGDGVLSDLLGPLLHEDEEIWVVDEGLFTRVPKCQRKIQMEGGPQRKMRTKKGILQVLE